MKNDLKQFCKSYKERLDLPKRKEEGKKYESVPDEINFEIYAYEKNYRLFPYSGVNRGKYCLTLDDEDLKYLYDKYSGRLKEEMDQKIEEIKEEYKDI